MKHDDISRVLGSSILRAIGILCLTFAGVVYLRFEIIEQYSFLNSQKEWFLSKTYDSRLLTHRARYKYLFEADLKDANQLLQRALVLSPYYIPAWLSLAELKNDQGDKILTNKIYEYLNLLTLDLNKYRWEKTLLTYQLGKNDRLSFELKYIISHIKGKTKRDALQLAFQLYEPAEELLRAVGKENVVHLFNYARSKGYAKKAMFFWEVICADQINISNKKIIAFVDMLIRNGNIEEAGQIWRERFNQGAIVYNGDFSRPFLNRAFSWRPRKQSGFEIKREKEVINAESEHQLYIRYKGWDNLRFDHFYQIVPLSTGKSYQLSANIKSERLTTDKRPYIEVYGYKCGSFQVASDMIGQTHDWKLYTLNFEIGENCSAAVIRIKRDESSQIDSKIAGKLWIRNITVAELHTH